MNLPPAATLAVVTAILLTLGLFAQRVYPGYSLKKSITRGLIASGLAALLAGAYILIMSRRMDASPLLLDRDHWLVAVAILVGCFLITAWLGDVIDLWLSDGRAPRPLTALIGFTLAVVVGLTFGISVELCILIAALAMFGRYLWVKAASVPRDRFAATPPATASDLERERVLTMLENGSVTPEEAAELLSALGERTSAPARIESPNRVLIAAGLLVVGFCLPWFHFRHSVPRGFAIDPGLIPAETRIDLWVNGAGVGGAIGWFILVLGLMVSLLPVACPQMQMELRRKLSLVGTIVGLILIGYIALPAIQHLAVGLLLLSAGYGCLIWEYLPNLGILPKRQPATPAFDAEETA